MDMKRQAEQIKRELEASNIDINEVEGIRIRINGAQDFRSIDIDQRLICENNKTALENGLLKSVNAAIKKSQELGAQKMRDMTGFDIPGLS